MADNRASVGRSVLLALAGMTAYEARLSALDVLGGEDDPEEAFLGAVAVASEMAQEVRRLGGDPGVLMRQLYDKASELAYSS